MPITASTPDSDMVIASDLNESNRADNYYFCRFCGSEMKLILPKKNVIKHFRHVPGADCIYESESMAHLEAKYFFYNLYKDNPIYERVELESRWNGIEHDRIGDVVLYPRSKSTKPTVIEIQNSSISSDEIISRFEDWNATDLTPDGLYSMMWVITANVIKAPKPYHNDETRVPMWVRTLHKIYMGRVYVYANDAVYSMHFDNVLRYNDWKRRMYPLKTVKKLSVKKVGSYNILQTNSGGGNYGDDRMISRFYDKKFW